MKVLVTGGAGFIGSHLVDALVSRGDTVIVVDDLSTGKKEYLNSAVRFYQIDIRDALALEKVFAQERPEIVSHHAAQTDVTRSMCDPSFDAQVNILGSLNIIRSTLQYHVRKIIFASTSAIYPEPKYVPVDENHPIKPVSAYGLSKCMVEQYMHLFSENFAMCYTAFRYGNVYGPRQDSHGESGVVAIFSQQILDGIQPTIFGNGSKTRDYIYVDDVVMANISAIDGAGDKGIFNLGWGREIKDIDVFEAVRNVLKVQVKPQYADKRPGELERIALDSKKAKSDLSWTPRVSFEEGIQQTVQYYKRHK